MPPRGRIQSAYLLQLYAIALSNVAATVLASRYMHATQEDMKRLKRAISYLGADPGHCLTLRPESMTLVCSADASYAVHADGKSHSGICLGFKGCTEANDSYCVFSCGKQSIVTNSSCEAELVCSNSGATYLVWGGTFLKGFKLERSYYNPSELHRCDLLKGVPILLQDNTSTIHLIEKGRGSFKNTKHIRVRHFFITDLVKSGKIVLVWQSTKDMVSDILSKGVTYAVFVHLLPRLIGRNR